jgi:hypothetical protein
LHHHISSYPSKQSADETKRKKWGEKPWNIILLTTKNTGVLFGSDSICLYWYLSFCYLVLWIYPFVLSILNGLFLFFRFVNLSLLSCWYVPYRWFSLLIHLVWIFPFWLEVSISCLYMYNCRFVANKQRY